MSTRTPSEAEIRTGGATIPPTGKARAASRKAFCVKRNLVLPVTSLLLILLASFHLVDDIVYGSEKGVASNALIVVILAVWLYGTVMLPERRVGHIIMLLGSPTWADHFPGPRNRPRRPPRQGDRQIERSLFLRLDAPCACGCFSFVAHGLSAGSMESAALKGAIMNAL